MKALADQLGSEGELRGGLTVAPNRRDEDKRRDNEGVTADGREEQKAVTPEGSQERRVEVVAEQRGLQEEEVQAL